MTISPSGGENKIQDHFVISTHLKVLFVCEKNFNWNDVKRGFGVNSQESHRKGCSVDLRLQGSTEISSADCQPRHSFAEADLIS
ncbi:hypothetical protein TNCV_1721961 [Trichonephila clavipes]|nr:hypothetical protein TNCV_1721961 [Trichonephila clavipes]